MSSLNLYNLIVPLNQGFRSLVGMLSHYYKDLYLIGFKSVPLVDLLVRFSLDFTYSMEMKLFEINYLLILCFFKNTSKLTIMHTYYYILHTELIDYHNAY